MNRRTLSITLLASAVSLTSVYGQETADSILHLHEVVVTGTDSSIQTIFTRLENITEARCVVNRGYDMPGVSAMGGFNVNF